MPFIYKPFRQTMSPNNITLNPAVSNTFYVNINGQICNGYRFRIFDMNNTLIVGASTNLVTLSSPLYDGDTLEIAVGSGLLTAGNQYKWQVDLYSTFTTVSAVSTANDTLTVANHNLLTGDIVFIKSSTTLPTAYSYAPAWVVDTSYVIGEKVFYTTNSTYYTCKADHTSSLSILPTNATYWDATPAVGLLGYTKYYIRVVDKDTVSLFENVEAARNNQGVLDLTTTGSGTIQISNVAISDEMPFMVYNIPTVSLTVSTLTSQSYEFVPTYTHTQGVLVNKFQAFLYDADSVLIDSSDLIYSSNVRYTFNGFLSGTVLVPRYYGIKFIITNNAGQISDTGIITFDVLYSSPSLIISAVAENICKDSCIKVSWGNLIQISGDLVGHADYLDNYLTLGGYGLSLDSGTTLDYVGVEMLVGGTLPFFMWQPLSITFTGLIAEFENSTTTENIKIYYDGTKFYQDRGGVILNNLPLSLTLNGAYLIGVIGNELYTNLIGTYVV